MHTVALVDQLASATSAALEDELLTLNAHLSAATYRFLVLVRTFDERVAWGDIGMRSMAHWLNWRCGIDLGAAREQVRVAHALAGLPLTSAALAAGTIRYSKVRALSRVATAANEDFFLGIAEYGTASHVEKTVRLVKRGLAVDDASRLVAMVERCRCDWYHDCDGMLVLQARLMPDEGARLVKAIRCLESSDRTVPLAARRASALAMVAEGACAPDGDNGGTAVPEIVVHVHAGAAATDAAANAVSPSDASPTESSAYIEDAVAISRATTERLCCDAAIVPMHHSHDGELLSIGRRSRTIPPAIRRALNARDKGCRFPGCTHNRFLHGHHIRHWSQEGETSLANLVTLCSFHHTLVHEGGFRITRSESGDFEWLSPAGRRIDSPAPTRRGEASAIVQTNTALGLDVSAATCDSKWDGQPADYDLVLTAFFSRADVRASRALHA